MENQRRDQNIIYVISIVALSFLIWLIYFAPALQTSSPLVDYLPLSNAICNTLCTLFLVTGFIQIKKGNKVAHKKSMIMAFIFSALFLIGYLIYHAFHGDTKYTGQGVLRTVYFFILISHILLSAVTFPLILTTFYQAFKNNWDKHKKLAKWTFPLWLYVSVTGVAIYVFLHHIM